MWLAAAALALGFSTPAATAAGETVRFAQE